MTVTIHFRGTTVAVDTGSDRTVLELAREAGWHIEAKCGGRGSCASCSVLLGEGHYRVFSEEIEVLPDQRREVLACQTRITGDHAEIFIPNNSVISSEGARIADEMEIPDHPCNPRFNQGFGIAVDIGTTTVVAALIDLASGTLLQRASLYNQQILKADDVVSRISLCSEDGQLESLKELVIAHTLNPLIHKLCNEAGTDPKDIVHVAASGNTVMMHLFYGVSPESIGVIPFQPARRFTLVVSALAGRPATQNSPPVATLM